MGYNSPTRTPCVIFECLRHCYSPGASPLTLRRAPRCAPHSPSSHLLHGSADFASRIYTKVSTLLPPIRARHASLLRHRCAIRALAMVWWPPRDAVRPTRITRRLFFADSTTSPNWPATPRKRSFGCSPPTRRPCVVLAGPVHCPSRRRPPPATRLAHGQGLACSSVLKTYTFSLPPNKVTQNMPKLGAPRFHITCPDHALPTARPRRSVK